MPFGEHRIEGETRIGELRNPQSAFRIYRVPGHSIRNGLPFWGMPSLAPAKAAPRIGTPLAEIAVGAVVFLFCACPSWIIEESVRGHLKATSLYTNKFLFLTARLVQ